MLSSNLLRCFGKGIAKIEEGHPIEDQAKRMGLVAQRWRGGREHATAQLALPHLYDLKFIPSRAFAMMRALPQCGQRVGGFAVCGNASGEWKRSGHAG
jgi:hypothetical protein